MAGIETNTNRIILLTRNSIPSNSEDISDWKHSIYNIFTEDINLSSGTEKVFDKVGNKSYWESSIVNDNIDLLMTSQPKFSTSNSYDAIEGDLDSLKQGAADTYDVLTDLIPIPFGPILKIFGNAMALGTKIGEKAYEASQSVRAIGHEGSTGMAFTPWYDNLPAWRSADKSITFAYVFNFSLGQYGLWNAREEVYKPIMNLLAMASPRYLTSFGISGPFPNANQLLLSLGGNTLKEVLKSDKPDTKKGRGPGSHYSKYEEKSSNYDYEVNQEQMDEATTLMEGIFKNTLNNFTYTIKFGNFLTLNHVLIKNCDCEFSKEVDQFGYPISGSVTVQFSTVLPYTLGVKGSGVIPVRFKSV